MSQFFESLRMRDETENESSHNEIEGRDWEWEESFPWESRRSLPPTKYTHEFEFGDKVNCITLWQKENLIYDYY